MAYVDRVYGRYGVVASFVLVLAATSASAYAAGGRTLWTTQEDFTGWSAGNAGEQSLAPVATPDSDGSSTNGSANYTAPGAAGTAGAQSVTWASGTFNYFYSTDLGANTSLQTYMGTQGVIKFDYTYPQIHVGSYFSLGAVLNYDTAPYANFYFQQFFGTNSATVNANGFNTTTIDYTGFLPTTAKDYFQIGVIYNSDYSPLDPYYIDNFHVIGHGDLNGDGHVDALDIQTMEGALTDPTAYENTYGLSAADLVTIGDFNGDGKFTGADLQGFLNYLKNGNGSISSVPEPASMILIGLAVPALSAVAYRRRKYSTMHKGA